MEDWAVPVLTDESVSGAVLRVSMNLDDWVLGVGGPALARTASPALAGHLPSKHLRNWANHQAYRRLEVWWS